jgi:HEAT repeat protein
VAPRLGNEAAILISVVQKRDGQVRDMALTMLGSMGEKAKPVVADLAKELAGTKEPTQRASLIASLGRLGPVAAEAIPQLRSSLRDNDPRVVRAAATALGEMGESSESASKDLIVVLGRNGEPFDAAVEALAKIGKPAVPELAKSVKGVNAQVQIGCAKALAKIGPDAKSAVASLLQASKSKSPEVRAAVKEALDSVQR